MKTKYLLLWLEGMLQAWGQYSKFDRRTTLPFPTKSGVTGLILNAMGRTGEEKELLKILAPMKFTAISFQKENQKNYDNQILIDYQVVGNGYNENDEWEKNCIIKKADGTKVTGEGSKITYRYYIQDGKFAVIYQIPESLEKEIVSALKEPAYDIFLGRKNCPPSELVFRGVYATEEEALKSIEKIAKEKNLIENLIARDAKPNEDYTEIHDVPERMGPCKSYKSRRVNISYLRDPLLDNQEMVK